MKLHEIGEFGLINRIKPLSICNPSTVLVGIGDDAAVLPQQPERVLLATADMLVEGIHFRREWTSLADLGHKAMAINLSDIAAMGGRPLSALVTIALPPSLTVEEVEELYTGMIQLARQFGVNIVGGDTVRSTGGVCLSLTLLGEATPDHVVLRSGAQVEDVIVVTGDLGASAAGLHVLANAPVCHLPETKAVIRRHLRPEPRVEIGQRLAATGLVTAMNDISDGLASEVTEICSASQTGAVLWVEALPISTTTRAIARHFNAKEINWALYGGEDYELVFTTAPANLPSLTEVIADTGCPLTVVGEILPAPAGRWLQSANGSRTELTPRGFNHFYE
ncbi:MAG: thiamine-phosphate kinase [Firmicutes bacterium]|nr:thiamine-phosphate kinase [Bacillota bacterium]